MKGVVRLLAVSCLVSTLCAVFAERASAQVAAAQVAAAEVAAAEDAVSMEEVVGPRTIDWQQTIRNGGKLMYVLAALSIVTVAFVIYFLVVLRVGQVAPRPLHRELVEKIRAGQLDDARRACEYRSGPLASVTLAAINYVADVTDARTALVQDVVEGEGARQAETIIGSTQYLLDIAAIAPMVGLLGTVFGMLRAFSSVALDLASAKPVNLAAGVSQALITTAFGLMVGILAMMFYAYFRRRATKMVSCLEIASTDVLTALLSEERGRNDSTVRA